MQLSNVQEPHSTPKLHGPWGPDSALRQACWLNAACCSFGVKALAPDLHWHKQHLGTNEGKALQNALKTIFPRVSMPRNAGQDPVTLGQSTWLPPSSAQLGRHSILPSMLTLVEKKVLCLLSSLAALPDRAHLQSSKPEEAGCVGRCRGPGSSKAPGCVGSYWLSRSAALPEVGNWGNWGQRANESEAKGFSKEAAFLLQTNSIRNILMETRFVTPTQADRTKGAYMTCCHMTNQGSSPWFPAGL